LEVVSGTVGTVGMGGVVGLGWGGRGAVVGVELNNEVIEPQEQARIAIPSPNAARVSQTFLVVFIIVSLFVKCFL